MKEFDPYSDFSLMHDFIELNYQDFEMHCIERGIHHDYYLYEEINYLEQNDASFRRFAERALADLKADDIERENDQKKVDNID